MPTMNLLDTKRSRRKPRKCEICDLMYVPTYGAQRSCSRACGVIIRGQTPGGKMNLSTRDLNAPCTSEKAWLKEQEKLKQKLYMKTYMKTYMRERYRNNPAARAHNQANSARRSARLRGSTGRADNLSLEQISQRDGNRCHICGSHVNKDQRSLDHLIPTSKGGEHTESNVALAHRSCNSRRGPGRLPAQLRCEFFLTGEHV